MILFDDYGWADAGWHRNYTAPGGEHVPYAPDVQTSLVEVTSSEIVNASPLEVTLADCAIVDFAGSMSSFRDQCLGYRDLSVQGNVSEAAAAAFSTLRWTETVAGAKQVLIANAKLGRMDHEHTLALQDRLFRASSGTKVIMDETGKLFFS